jgi:hypothetical protein
MSIDNLVDKPGVLSIIKVRYQRLLSISALWNDSTCYLEFSIHEHFLKQSMNEFFSLSIFLAHFYLSSSEHIIVHKK